MRVVFSVILLFCLLACRKEPTSWDTDIHAPLIQSTLGLKDLIADSLITASEDGLAMIVYEEQILDFGLDSLVNIPSDTVSKSFSIFPVSQFTFTSGQTFYSNDDEFELDGDGALLTQAAIASGELIFTATNEIQGDLYFEVEIPLAIKNGEPLVLAGIIPAANNGSVGVLTTAIDVSDFELDLTGENGNDFNTLNVSVVLSVPQNSNPITVFGTDEVTMNLFYSQLRVKEAYGYFGSRTEVYNESSAFDLFDELSGSIINLDDVRSTITLTNGFGADLTAVFEQFKLINSESGNSISLNHSIIGTETNLSRAVLSGNTAIPSTEVIEVNRGNSNIVEMLELLPDSLRLKVKATINPLENISNFNDFAVENSHIQCNLKVEVPFRFSIDQYSIEDTVDFTWNEDLEMINGGFLYLYAENEFPLDIDLELTAMNGAETFILKPIANYSTGSGNGMNSAVISGSTSNEGAISLIKYELDSNTRSFLQNTNRIAIKGRFSTTGYPNLVEFDFSDRLRLLLSANVLTTFSIE